MEWDIQSMDLKNLREDFDLGDTAAETLGNAGIMGVMGTGVGAAFSGAPWVIKRLKLQRALKTCNGDAKCEKTIRAQIEELNTKTKSDMKRGAIVGGASGVGLGVMRGIRHGVGSAMQDDSPAARVMNHIGPQTAVKVPSAPTAAPPEEFSSNPEVRRMAGHILSRTVPPSPRGNGAMNQTLNPSIDLKADLPQPHQSTYDIEGPSRRTSALPTYEKFFGPRG